MNYYSEKSGKNGIVMSQETINILTNHNWPGNIRQLCSELRRIVAFAESGDLITPDDLSPGIICSQGGLYLGKAMISQIDNLLQEQRLSFSDAVEVFERALINRALELHSGSISPTARVLGLTRRGFKLKMKRFNITTVRRTRS
jgi:DNA-binding NtrC family response regulator